jgi:hypothetical protein
MGEGWGEGFRMPVKAGVSLILAFSHREKEQDESLFPKKRAIDLKSISLIPMYSPCIKIG